MNKDTTTPTDQEEQAPAEESQAQGDAQPDETQAVQDEADTTVDADVSADVNAEEETSDTPKEPDEESSLDDDILDWAQKKGIKTDDPKALLKMVRESETKMHSATNEAKALRDTVQNVGEEEGLGEASQLINRLKVTDFYMNTPGARDFDAEMAEIVRQKPYLAEDLSTVYDLARFRSAEAKLDDARKAGRKEALSIQAQAELAGAPKASATTRSMPKTITDDDIANMTLEEYKQAKESGQIKVFST